MRKKLHIVISQVQLLKSLVTISELTQKPIFDKQRIFHHRLYFILQAPLLRQQTKHSRMIFLFIRSLRTFD